MPITGRLSCWRLGFDRVMSTSTHHCGRGHLPTARLVSVDLLMVVHVVKDRTTVATVILCPAICLTAVISTKVPCSAIFPASSSAPYPIFRCYGSFGRCCTRAPYVQPFSGAEQNTRHSPQRLSFGITPEPVASPSIETPQLGFGHHM